MLNNPTKKKTRTSYLLGALVSFILFLMYIFILIYLIVGRGYSSDGISVFPGGVIIDLVFMFIVPVIFQILAVLLSTLLSRLYIKIASWMKMGKYPIHVKKLEKKFTLGEFFSRAFYAAMLSIALSIALNNLLNDEGITLFIQGSLVYSVAAISFILTPLSVLIMTPAWILDDSGILFMKRENYDELSGGKTLSNSLDVRGIGSYFISIIKGFAGISTPLLYIQLFVQQNIFRNDIQLGFLLLLEPFFLVGSFFFSWWIYLKIIPKIRKKLLGKLPYPEIVIKIQRE